MSPDPFVGAFVFPARIPEVCSCPTLCDFVNLRVSVRFEPVFPHADLDLERDVQLEGFLHVLRGESADFLFLILL